MKEKELKNDDSLTSEDIEYIKNDWYSLNAKRIFIPNSFDFTVQTVGIFTAYQLVKKACQIIYNSFETFKGSEIQINDAESTIVNSFDIILYEKDHTFGKCLEYFMYSMFFEGEDKKLSYCGFQKKHPHDDYSVLRVAYKQEVDANTIKQDIYKACDMGVYLFKEIEQLFIE